MASYNELFFIVLDSILSDNGDNDEELDMFCWFSEIESLGSSLNEVFIFSFLFSILANEI